MTALFHEKTLRWVIGIGVTSFLVFLCLNLFGDLILGRSSHGPDGYSTSAVGHKALVKWLEALDIPVDVSRVDPLLHAPQESLLLVLAPAAKYVSEPDTLDLGDLRSHSGPVLVSLPKWTAGRHPTKPRHVSRPRWSVDIEEIMGAVGLEAEIDRPETVDFQQNPLGRTVKLAEPQVLRRLGRPFNAVISGGDRVLLARSDNLWVLSDPDVFSTRGLADEETALFGLELLEHIRGGRPVVMDETTHGHLQRPGAWREFFEFPLVLVLIQALLIIAFAVWCGMVRFGDPRERPPSVAAGKQGLVDNTASLLAFARREPDVLRRYLHLHLQIASRRAHLGATAARGKVSGDGLMDEVDQGECPVALSELSARRGTTEAPEDLVDEVFSERQRRHVTPRRLLQLARRIHHWKQEIVDGSAVDPRARG